MAKPITLIILDGWGTSQEIRGNAIASANTPTIDYVEKYFPSTLLQASGISVGLPWNEPGNSEVGHMNMGTGSIRYQPLTRINKAILDGSFFKNQALGKAAEHVKKNKSALHLMGLVSSGSVHAYLDHLHALLEFAQHENISPVYLHVFLDGRDSPPREGASVVSSLEKKLKGGGEGMVSTVIGRHYAMDRDKRWESTIKTHDLIVGGKGQQTKDLVEKIKQQYERGITDEFIEPIVKIDAGLVSKNDALLFFNFREDSARQLASVFSNKEIPNFSQNAPENLLFVTMTQYDKGLGNEIILPPLEVRNTVSELVSKQGWQQLKVGESEKYAHVTYFFNGGKEDPFEGEDRSLVPSLKVESYEDAPQMRAQEIGKTITSALSGEKHKFIVANFANADMVAHTGNFEATKKAVEIIDRELGSIVSTVLSKDGVLIITSDHGHAEQMLDLRTGEEVTKHSPNPVPFYLIRQDLKSQDEARKKTKENIHGILSDVAATVLDLFNITPPPEIEGKSLLSILR